MAAILPLWCFVLLFDIDLRPLIPTSPCSLQVQHSCQSLCRSCNEIAELAGRNAAQVHTECSDGSHCCKEYATHACLGFLQSPLQPSSGGNGSVAVSDDELLMLS